MNEILAKHPWIGVVFPYSVLLIHCSVFGSWIVDDAGISFAYTRNFVNGHGLAAQPGVEPVEGYSNPTWVFLLAPFFVVGAFHYVIVPKVVGYLCALGTFYLLHRWMTKDAPERHVVAFVALTGLALNTSYAVWTTAGLENGLYGLLVTALVYLSYVEFSAPKPLYALPAVVGMITGLAALTRPDGMIYAGLYPALFVLVFLGMTKASKRGALLRLAAFGLSFLITFGSYVVFRLAYFGYPLPNTYYAKSSGEGFASLLTLSRNDMLKLDEFLTPTAGPVAPLVIIALGAAVVWLFVKGRMDTRLAPGVLGLTLAFAAFVVLPGDFMGEFRFATPFMALQYPVTFLILWYFFESIPRLSNRTGWAVAVMAATIAIVAVFSYAPRTMAYREAPALGMANVIERFGKPYDELAEFMEIEDATVLMPDLGGTLWESELRVYDMAGLCNQRIAHLAGTRNANALSDAERRAYYDYIFEDIKPTFIRLHFPWTWRTRLQDQARFERDYVPLWEYQDRRFFPQRPRRYPAGDYVRKDVLDENFDEVRAFWLDRVLAYDREHYMAKK